MNEVKKVLFIINKFAGTGYRPELEGRILRNSEQFDIECRIEFTEGPNHATEIASKAAQLGVQRVVAVGGDGTLNEVARALIHTNIPMGIIARGSGNGLARHLSIPLSIPLAIDNIFHGKVLTMDTFNMNNKLSLNVSGIGFDGHIANLFGGKIKRGLSGYANLALKEYLTFKEFEFDLAINDLRLTRKAFVLAIANSTQYGNNACIAPAASVTDGLLHVNILKKVPPYRFDFLYALFTKAIHKSGYTEILESSALDITTSKPVPYHVDGEPCGVDTRFTVEVTPGALQVIIPDKINAKRLP